MMWDALKMGSYGSYVWSCYGLTLLALVLLAVSAQRSWQKEIKNAQRRAQIAEQAAERP